MATHRQPAPDRDSRTYLPSIRRLVGLLAVALAALLIAMAALEYRHIDRHFQDIERAEDADRLRFMQQFLAFRINTYQQLVNQLATTSQVFDLLAVNDHPGAATWAQMTRRLMPEAVGAALFASDGTLLGDALAQRVGTQCLSDLVDSLNGLPVARPPIHDAIPGLEHFDLTAPVHDLDGETIGMVFVSFSTRILDEALAELATEDEHLAIANTRGELITRTRAWDDVDRPAARTAIPGTDWNLLLITRQETLGSTLPGLILIVGLGSVLAMLIVLIITRLLYSNYLAEFRYVQRVLEGLKEGALRDDLPPSRYREFAHLRNGLAERAERIASKHESLHALGHTDALTGLANRREFERVMDEMLEHGSGRDSFWLVALDLDRFKAVNDTLGHDMGDRVLKALGTALRTQTRDGDMAFRWGGDEFVLLITSGEDFDLAAWLERLQADFLRLQTDELELPPELVVTIGYGGTCITPDDKRPLAEILKEVDAALYARKAAGRR
ncbi:MAG: diguanylate cyclase [Gammaproteobacteria bacterium]|nr:diguanylate cyclase [Gammaproteobacteria bacterium]MDX5375231.1 diguanylate cyclase [Gammaproteobacteria bacterium]